MNGAIGLAETYPWSMVGDGIAVSEDGKRLSRLVDEVCSFRRSVSLGAPREKALQALIGAWQESRDDEWIEVGNLPVELSTLRYAHNLLNSLPTAGLFMDIAPDPDGEVIFEWDRGPHRVLSVSVGPNGNLSFAALERHRKLYGTDHTGETLPEAIRRLLEDLIA